MPANHIAHVIQAGYVDGDKVLRPAKVMVSRGPAPVADEPDPAAAAGAA